MKDKLISFFSSIKRIYPKSAHLRLIHPAVQGQLTVFHSSQLLAEIRALPFLFAAFSFSYCPVAYPGHVVWFPYSPLYSQFLNMMKVCSYDGSFSKTYSCVQDIGYLCKSPNLEIHTIFLGSSCRLNDTNTSCFLPQRKHYFWSSPCYVMLARRCLWYVSRG